MTNNLKFNHYIIIRLWGRETESKEVCVLSTRGVLLSRHYRRNIAQGVSYDNQPPMKLLGLRRFRTMGGAARRAAILNKHFQTNGYIAIKESDVYKKGPKK